MKTRSNVDLHGDHQLEFPVEQQAARQTLEVDPYQESLQSNFNVILKNEAVQESDDGGMEFEDEDKKISDEKPRVSEKMFVQLSESDFMDWGNTESSEIRSSFDYRGSFSVHSKFDFNNCEDEEGIRRSEPKYTV